MFKRSRSEKTLVEWLVVLAILLVIFGMAAGAIGGCTGGIDYAYSEGTRSGVVLKFSKKGLFWKTHEGELALQVNTSVDGSVVPAIWEFSCKDEAVAAKIRAAEERGARVTLVYVQPLLMGWDDGKTSYLVTDVREYKPVIPAKE